jgi:predicted type IV restriction endonuclease
MATRKRPMKPLTTTEARRSLPGLVKAAARRRTPGRDLRANAVEILPRGEERKALLVPEVDIEAAERRIAELEETLEDVELMRVIEERVVTGQEPGTPIEDVIRELGRDHLLDDLPGA